MLTDVKIKKILKLVNSLHRKYGNMDQFVVLW